MAVTFNDYLEALKQPVITPCFKLDWLYPNGRVAWSITEDCYNSSGMLNINYGIGTRRTFSIQMHNIDNKYDADFNKVWFGQQLKLYLGLYVKGEPYYLPQGVFYITNPRECYNPSERYMNLNCVDKWAYLDGTLFGNLDGIYQVPVNSNIKVGIEKLLQTPKGNGMPIDPVPPLISNYFNNKYTKLSDGTEVPIINTPYTMRVDRGQTYADVLLEFNIMLSSVMYYNENGQLRVEPNEYELLDRDKEIIYTFTPDNSEMLSRETEYRFTETFNDIITIGTVLNGNLATGRATNTDVRSDLCMQKIGKKTKVFENAAYYSDEMAQEWAEFLLKENSIVNKSVTLTCSPIYHLDVNKLILAYNPKKNYQLEKYLITGLSIPLNYQGIMTINCTSVNDLIFSDEKEA